QNYDGLLRERGVDRIQSVKPKAAVKYGCLEKERVAEEQLVVVFFQQDAGGLGKAGTIETDDVVARSGQDGRHLVGPQAPAGETFDAIDLVVAAAGVDKQNPPHGGVREVDLIIPSSGGDVEVAKNREQIVESAFESDGV